MVEKSTVPVNITKEDPGDFRPYCYRVMIYSLVDKNDEAKVQFVRCREL